MTNTTTLTIESVKGRWVKLSDGRNVSRTQATEMGLFAETISPIFDAADRAELATQSFVEHVAAELDTTAEDAGIKLTTYTGPMLKLRERLKAGKYAKAPNGQPCCGDLIATAFGTLKPEQTIAACVIALGCGHNPYGHLNIGQQSMNLRNRVRNAYKRGEFGFGVVREAIEEVTGEECDVTEADDEGEEEQAANSPSLRLRKGA